MGLLVHPGPHLVYRFCESPGRTRGFEVRILVESYACSPRRGSEPGNGWSWPFYLAQAGCDVVVLTSPRRRKDIEQAVGSRPQRMRVEYVAEVTWPLFLGWTVGSKLRYLLWLRAAGRRAKKLHSELPFDLAHHVSYGSLAAGTQLWRLGIPLVLGPVGDGQAAPSALKQYFGREWARELLRSLIVRHVIPYSPGARRASRAAKLVLASNAETADLAFRLGAARVEIQAPDAGIPVGHASAALMRSRSTAESFRLLWVGRVFAIRGLPLVLDAMTYVTNARVTLDIVGVGTYGECVNTWIRERGLDERVRYHGQVEWSDVRDFYARSHALLFTSLRDSCAVQLLEAMAFGLRRIGQSTWCGASCTTGGRDRYPSWESAGHRGCPR